MNTGDTELNETDEQPHWACGKVDCDCDDQYEAWKDAEMMANEDWEREQIERELEPHD